MTASRGERPRVDTLMAALAQGDRGAFDPIFEELWPLLWGFCRRYLGDDLAQDAAQAALLRIFERSALYDPERPALPWAVAIAFNEVRTLRKRQARRREVPLDALAESPSGVLASTGQADALRLLEDAEAVAALRDVLAELGARDVEALLASVGAQSRQELPGPTFRKRLERALERLRGAWSRRHG